MYLLAEQYAKPTLENSLKALEESNYVVIVERVLKLSTTAVVIWLLMFYALFHAFLNALSEVS
jgi:diacylglycerol O-acyltransferase-1